MWETICKMQTNTYVHVCNNIECNHTQTHIICNIYLTSKSSKRSSKACMNSDPTNTIQQVRVETLRPCIGKCCFPIRFDSCISPYALQTWVTVSQRCSQRIAWLFWAVQFFSLAKHKISPFHEKTVQFTHHQLKVSIYFKKRSSKS